MITHAKVDCDVHDDAIGVVTDGWKYVYVIDPQTGCPPTDGQGRLIEWSEINVAEGWGFINDEDDQGVQRVVRVAAPWIRLLKLELRLPSGLGSSQF